MSSNNENKPKVSWTLAYQRRYHQRPEVKERRRQLRLEKAQKAKQAKNNENVPKVSWTLAYQRRYHQRPEVKERRRQLRLEKAQKAKKAKQAKNNVNPTTQIVVNIVNGKYVTEEGIELIPSNESSS